MLDIDIIRSSLEITLLDVPSYVIALLIDPQQKNNTLKKIPCKKGCYASLAYDIQSDSIILECIDFLYLGSISKSYSIKMPFNFGWGGFIPLPEGLLKQYLSDTQLSDIEKWLMPYKDKEYVVHYVQMVDSQFP
jgi:hypothetical protein